MKRHRVGCDPLAPSRARAIDLGVITGLAVAARLVLPRFAGRFIPFSVPPQWAWIFYFSLSTGAWLGVRIFIRKVFRRNTPRFKQETPQPLPLPTVKHDDQYQKTHVHAHDLKPISTPHPTEVPTAEVQKQVSQTTSPSKPSELPQQKSSSTSTVPPASVDGTKARIPKFQYSSKTFTGSQSFAFSTQPSKTTVSQPLAKPVLAEETPKSSVVPSLIRTPSLQTTPDKKVESQLTDIPKQTVPPAVPVPATIDLAEAAKKTSCDRCGKQFESSEEPVCILGTWHRTCFRCHQCGDPLTPATYEAHKNRAHCTRCYETLNFATVRIKPTAKRASASAVLDVPDKALISPPSSPPPTEPGSSPSSTSPTSSPIGRLGSQSKASVSAPMLKKFGGSEKCEICGKSVFVNEQVKVMGVVYHKQCFKVL